MHSYWTFDDGLNENWSFASCLAKRHKRKRLLGGNQDVFNFQVWFLFFWVLQLVISIATPLYLYFKVLCQVLASNGRESKSYDKLSKNRLCTLRWKIPRKITKTYFWSKFFAHHDPCNFLDFISLEFSDLSNISASINSSSADCPVLADCSLVFQSYLLKVFNLGFWLKVPWFELSNSSLCIFWSFLCFSIVTKWTFIVYVH